MPKMKSNRSSVRGETRKVTVRGDRRDGGEMFPVDALRIVCLESVSSGVIETRFRGRRPTVPTSFRGAARLVSVLAATIGLSMLAPTLAQAATFRVTTTADSNDEACTATLCSFRDALAAAGSATANTATVVVPAGTYKATMLGGNGVFDPEGAFTIQGAGAGQTIIDGNQLGRVFALYGQITMTGVTVTGGKAPDTGCACGGAFEVRQGGALTLINSIVEGNSAPYGDGGGIDVDSQSTGVLQDDLITQNTAVGAGGGVHVEAASVTGGSLQMTDTTISGNTTSGSANGGGLDNQGSTTAQNVTFAGNSSGGSGGAIMNESTGTLSLDSTTIAGNLSGGTGAGIDNAGTAANLAVQNTIVADGCVGTLTSHGHNLDSGKTCGFTQTGDVAGVNPRLAQLAQNGGPVPTVALLAGSPAINAGNNAACPATDARGIARPQGGVCDIGAYEYAPPTLSLGSPTGVAATTATVQGTITPNLRDTTYHFNYGTTTAYGYSTASTDVGSGTAAVPVTAPLTGLLPNTTYHYELLATNGDGTSTTADGTFTTLPATTQTPPRLSAVGQSPRRWAETSAQRRTKTTAKLTVGTTFSFRLNESAKVTLTFTESGAGRRVGTRCVAETGKNTRRAQCNLPRGTVTVAGRSGRNTLRFRGRVAGHSMPAGAYAVVITATNTAGQHSSSVTLHFTIIKH